MKITIPLTQVKTGGSLEAFYYDLIQFEDGVNVSNDGTNVYIESTTLKPSFTEIESILTAGGEVEEYLMAIQMPNTYLSANVPVGLPNQTNVLGETRTVKNWFNSNAEIWKKDDDTEVIFYTNPVGLSISQYLKGSEIKIINDVAVDINILTTDQAQTIIDGGGYTKV